MEQHFWTAFASSLMACCVTTLGLFVIRRYKTWGRRNSAYFASFAAGVLIAVSFLHIIPKSFSMNPNAPGYLLGGYLLMHVFNRFVTACVCDRPETVDYAIGLVPLIGIGAHSLLDGAVYSITFGVNIFTGIVTSIGMVLHEFPEGIVTFLLLLKGGFSERKALILAFLAAGLTTPLGMLLSFPFLAEIDRSLLGAFLALSSGALIYVGATHLLPQAEREAKQYSLVALAGGMAVALGIVISKG